MKLTAELVLEKLQERLQIQAYGNLAGRPAYGRPLLYEKKKTVRPGHFYVAEPEVLEEEDVYGEDVCFILTESAGECKIPEEIPYISIGSGETVFWIMNEVQDIFDRLDEWAESLGKIRNNNGSVEELLRVSHPLFKNPLAVVGTDFTLRYEAGVSQMPEEAQIFAPGVESMEYVNALIQDEAYNEMQKSREVFLFPGYITGFCSYNLNLWEKEECRFRLVEVEFEKPLTEGDKYLLEYLAPYVQQVIARKESVSEGNNDTLRKTFHRILTDRTADYIEISQQLAAHGWEQEAEYLCMVFQITYLDQRSLTSNTICAYLEKTYPGACSFFYKDEIVTFFNLGIFREGVDELEGRLKYFIRESFLKAGYSWVMQGHGNLRRQYIQAGIALDVGSRISPYLWIHHFNEVAFSYILEQSARRLPGYMLCHEKLLALQKSDEQQNTEYMRTLKTYLDNHLNAVQSAKELFIHRSTFLYRLDKIRAILESDLENPEELLYLSFSFRLLEKEQRKK